MSVCLNRHCVAGVCDTAAALGRAGHEIQLGLSAALIRLMNVVDSIVGAARKSQERERERESQTRARFAPSIADNCQSIFIVAY